MRYVLLAVLFFSGGLLFAASDEHRALCKERGSERPHGLIECICPNGLKVLTIKEEYCPGTKTFAIADILEKYYRTYHWDTPTYGEPKSYADFKGIIQGLHEQHGLTDVDALLKLFAMDPRLESFYYLHTRMHHSLSTQKGKRLLAGSQNLILGIPLDGLRTERIEIVEIDHAAKAQEMFSVHVLDFPMEDRYLLTGRSIRKSERSTRVFPIAPLVTGTHPSCVGLLIVTAPGRGASLTGGVKNPAA